MFLSAALNCAMFLTLSCQLYSQDLRGRFIWSVPNSKVEVNPGIVYFRKEFEVGKLKSALLEITCDDGFRVYVNRKLVGNDTVWQDVIRYDISPLIVEGKNVIAVHAENASKSPAGLYCKLTVNMEKETMTIPSDKSWKFSTVAKNGWRTAGYDDESWKPAFEQGIFGRTAPWGNEFNFKTQGTVTVAKKKNKLPRLDSEFVNGDRIVFLGGTFVERLQSNNYLEALLTSQFPNLDLKFRNLGWSGDNVFGLSRAVFGDQENGFRRLENDLLIADPTLVIVCYGFNESFKGKEFIPEFKSGLENLSRVIEENQSDIMFISPMLMEKLAPPLPDPREQNELIQVYSQIVRQFAAEKGYPFIDNLRPLGNTAHSKSAIPAIRDRLTDNGMHLNQYGHWRIAPHLVNKLGGNPKECNFHFDLNDQTYSADGSTLHEVSFTDGLVQFTALDDRLVNSPPPASTPRGGKMMAIHDEFKITGLPVGKYGLSINGKPTIMADQNQWAAGVLINRSIYLEQPEKLRQAIVKKNEMFFHRHRPQNETYLYLFRKHEQGNNAVEIPQFDPIIAAIEKQISTLKKPGLVKYRIHRIEKAE